MVLGFDVYAQPVEIDRPQLRELGFDLTKLHESTWQGRPAYVVGAAAGDTVTRQFWIDKERLYFVRMVEPGKQNPSAGSRRVSTSTSRWGRAGWRPRSGSW